MIDKAINVYSSLSKRNTDKDSIEFLRSLRDTKVLYTSNISADNIYRFFSLLLDASGIISATEGTFDSFSIGDTKHIGKNKDIKGILSGKEEGIRDWMCSVLFQGWVKHDKPNLQISKDLRYVLPKEQKACDFKILGKNISPALVECKRIHPEATNPSPNIIEKILEKLDEAKGQLKRTERYLNEGGFHKIVILDVASYGDNTVCEQGIMKVVGFQEDSHITSIIDELRRAQVSEIDEIIICWSNLYYFQGYPRAFAYYTRQIPLSQKPANISYTGWTIEYYPRGKDTRDYLELRISSIARSSAWIKASWHSTTDNLVTYTLENDLIDN